MRVASTVLTAALLVAGAAATVAPAKAAEPRPVIYFVPHQDDEVLTYGASVLEHTRGGRDVHLVLVTDGGASGVRRILASKGYDLSREEFSAARTREFVASAQALGVPADHLHYEGLRDAEVTIGEARAVVAKWMDRYPNASFKTMSPKDINPDHAALGYALRWECAERPGSDCRFMQFRRYWSTMPMSGWYTRADVAPLKQATASYSYWAPTQGRYAIGIQSVATAFSGMLADRRTKTSVNGW